MAESARREARFDAGAQASVLVFATRFSRVHRHCAGLLERGFQVHFVAAGAELLDLAPDQCYRAVVAFLPIPRAALDRLLARARDAAGRAPRPRLVLLACRSQLVRTQDLLARGVSRVLIDTATPESLSEAVVDLLRRAPRTHLNVPARLEVRRPGGPVVTWGQTVNLSTSGVLVEASVPHPLGSAVHVQLQVAGPGGPLCGVAHLARLARPEREGFEGVAARFHAFERDGETRLEALLRSRRP